MDVLYVEKTSPALLESGRNAEASAKCRCMDQFVPMVKEVLVGESDVRIPPQSIIQDQHLLLYLSSYNKYSYFDSVLPPRLYVQ